MLLIGPPGAGTDSFVEYLKLQQTRNTTAMHLDGNGHHPLNYARQETCCRIAVDSSHVVSFMRIPSSDLEKENRARLEQDCDRFFGWTEGR